MRILKLTSNQPRRKKGRVELATLLRKRNETDSLESLNNRKGTKWGRQEREEKGVSEFIKEIREKASLIPS